MLLGDSGNKLDCFGVAFAVVAACQVLGFLDVHLALSEDHAWVMFGKEEEQESAEVTWHGKGNEDKRGQPILSETQTKSWLYCNGHPVHCTRRMEVAALVSSINPSINATTDSIELSLLQRDLLWILYDMGDLRKYPMALGNLGDLEEISPSEGRPQPLNLFREAILATRSYYSNQHVYPYTYLGGFFFRNKRYKEALEAWANAAGVIRNYNYSRDDEEIYKEFLEIATELIPHMMKAADTGLLQDPVCYASLLRFYDGLCAWEEESPTPILHIGWAKPLVATIAKFPTSVRSAVHIEEDDKTPVNGTDQHPQEIIRSLIDAPSASPPHPNIAALAAACADNILNPEYLLGSGEPFSASPANHAEDLAADTSAANGTSFSSLNMEPTQSSPLLLQERKTTYQNRYDSLVHKTSLPACPRGSEWSCALAAQDPCQCRYQDFKIISGCGYIFLLFKLRCLLQTTSTEASTTTTKNASEPPPPIKITLSSKKMADMKELLPAEKLNTSAIQLLLTAQSQVHVTKRGHTQSLAVVKRARHRE
ncbi:MEN1 [Cordylochernes scorpioides]|uniref:Menin n=1 Tax=Cordylochernes scorpioides TaxID=51811 RepID=A0ABY6KAT7_9ARAC|nr:MEN1 [Cordylochernes scorpioides]